ncbi:hypothetical protein AAFF_G00036340 [Aldrovandia affinis]|uniref:Uncharacterized protein n=1 Tax=Aldrovandia affinis TaxID=143900 RepID=A0AAD7S3J6_9TELE|nr:hypothetical protein AAFF_G00036340 [Aldrovandia affinis]
MFPQSGVQDTRRAPGAATERQSEKAAAPSDREGVRGERALAILLVSWSNGAVIVPLTFRSAGPPTRFSEGSAGGGG